jgi:lipopolysaccharide assembly protein B
VAADYADSALQCADPTQRQQAQRALGEALAAHPSAELLRAHERLRAAALSADEGSVTATETPGEGASEAPVAAAGSDSAQALAQLLQHLQQHPSLSAVQLLLERPAAEWTDEAWAALRHAVSRAAKPLQRYRCAACGFEAQNYFWQCPGCLNWDSYPAQRLDAQ